MRDDEEPDSGNLDLVREIAALRAALQREHEALQAEGRRAMAWEREAVLRASTVAGTLMMRVLAAQRLAAVVDRNLEMFGGTGTSADEELRDALEFFRDVAGDHSTQ